MIYINFKAGASSEMRRLKKPVKGSWVDMINPTDTEIKQILKMFNVPMEFFTAALDPDERPRYDVENGCVLIIFKIPVKRSSGPLRFETIPIGIIITKEVIITACLEKTEIHKDFHEQRIKDFYTSKRTRFLFQILSRINRYYMRYLDLIESEIKTLEIGLTKSVKNEEIIQMFTLQKSLIYFNTAVIGNGNVLENIMKGKVLKFYEEDEDLLENIIVENRQAIEMISVYNNILSNTLDAYASIVSNNLNIVMKILTSLTIILAFPTIVASFYGMNVQLPLQENPMAFWITFLISILISMIAATIFVKKQWI